jgi:DNA-binding transcriptional MerR regulator
MLSRLKKKNPTTKTLLAVKTSKSIQMKNILLSLTLCFFCAFAFPAFAQKIDTKEWKKKKKAMSVEEFAKMMEEYDKLNGEKNALNRQQRDFAKKIAELDEKIAALKQEGRPAAEIPEEKEEEKPADNVKNTQDDFTKGEVYRVQVGAIRNTNLEKYVNHPRFHAETDPDGKKKFTIASFRDYQQADNFKNFLIKIGVKDAYWIKYVDNVRVDSKKKDW